MSPARSLAVVIGLAAALIAATPASSAIDADLDLMLGQLALDDSDNWRPLDDPPSVGFQTAWGDREWPVRIAAGLHFTRDDKTFPGLKLEGRTTELSVGVRRSYFLHRSVRPYIGAGLAAVDAEVESSGFGQNASADDLGVGFWLGSGLRWRVASNFTLGLAVRYSDVDVSLPFAVGGDIDGQAGGWRYGILLGWTLEKQREPRPPWQRGR